MASARVDVSDLLVLTLVWPRQVVPLKVGASLGPPTKIVGIAMPELD